MMCLYVLLASAPFVAIAGLLDLRGGMSADMTATLGLAAAVVLPVAALLGALTGAAMAQRLRHLMESTRRIAKQDFSVQVPVTGSDDVAQLTRAFNAMAHNLGVSLSVQGILAQMDDAILTKLDVGALVRSALRCLQQVTQAEVVVLGLFESEAADAMRIFVIRKGERSQIESQKLEMTDERKRHIPLKPMRKSSPDSPFPEEYEAQLRRDCAIEHYYAVPIARGNRAWGVMVSCHTLPAEITNSQFKMLLGVANRLIAGFSGAERDQKLHSLAYVDPLTGLPNRVAMQSLLSQELSKAQRVKCLAAILFIDLDRFKQANDTHGHSFGDRLLVQAAKRIRNNVRENDVVARIGGDEFTVILTEVKTPREAASVARKLIQALSRRFEIDGHTIYTGASVGIAMYPDDGVGGQELLKMADTAMYRAKSAGRSRFAFFEEPMNAETKRRSLLDGELRNALERRELVLQYQPQVDLKTGALCGVEALVRWQHPTRGLLYPRDFIEYAEEIGLIPEIGTWVLAEACQQYQRWQAEGVRVPRISVNVSNGQLPRTNFVPTVRQLIATTQMPPDALEIEVTESMLVEGGKPAVEALNQLSADGVLIAIDDFGTGYSSFSYLKTMPARVLKLDMSLLVDAQPDNDAGKIVAAIIKMAHALQKEVVAEGIERVDQLKLLKSLDCERGQGFLFGKAVDADLISRTYRRLEAGAIDEAIAAFAAMEARGLVDAPAEATAGAAAETAAESAPETVTHIPAPALPEPVPNFSALAMKALCPPDGKAVRPGPDGVASASIDVDTVPGPVQTGAQASGEGDEDLSAWGDEAAEAALAAFARAAQPQTAEVPDLEYAASGAPLRSQATV